jgi:WD40 repeat protein
MKQDNRKPVHFIQTIASVARVQWRSNANFGVAGTDYQIASCSLLTDNRIHVWDLNRPYVPLYTLEEHVNATTGFLWHDSDTIWSCSKDKFFIVNSISKNAYQLSRLLNRNALSWNAFGDIGFSTAVRAKGDLGTTAPPNDGFGEDKAYAGQNRPFGHSNDSSFGNVGLYSAGGASMPAIGPDERYECVLCGVLEFVAEPCRMQLFSENGSQ